MVLITCVARSATHERQHLDLEEQTSPLEAVPPYTAQTAGKRGVSISAQEDGMQVVPLVELADQNESCDSAKGGKCFQNELQVGLHKGEGKLY